jgi:hypothetical protein
LRLGTRRRLANTALAFLGATGVLVLVQSAVASTTITEDDIGCSGSADITSDDGEKTHIDAEDAEATVPREGTVRWRGVTDEAVHNHEGEIVVDTGLSDIPIDDWGSENAKDETEKRGRKQLPEVLKYLPPGTYLVTGSHSGDEGSCAGEIEITLEGGPEVAWKAGGVVLTVVAGSGLLIAGRPKW